MSPESVIRSVRGVFSLTSLRSNGSKREGSNDLERSNPNDSSKGLNDTHVRMGDLGSEKVKVTRHVSIEEGMYPVPPEEGIMAHKTFTVSADRV